MRYDSNGNSVGKVFDKELYEKTDGVVAEKFLESVKHWYAVKREEDFGIDAEIYYNKEDYEKGEKPLCTVELEVTLMGGWDKGNFPLNSVQVFERKTKNILSSKLPFHIQFNQDFTDCFILSYGEIIRSRVYEGNFKTGKDIYYKIPESLVTFGIENIEKYIFEYVCKLIKRLDFIERGFKNLTKKETKTLFKLANNIHNVLHLRHNNKNKVELINKNETQHKFFWQMVEDRNTYAEYLVYWDKKAFLNEEDVLFRLVIDRDDYSDWDKGETPLRPMIVRRTKSLYFTTKYIPFHIHFNKEQDDCITLPIGALVQSCAYDRKIIGTELGYLKPTYSSGYFGLENVEKYIFEYACEMLNNNDLKQIGVDNLSKTQVVSIFKMVNSIYNTYFGLDKLI